jgi:hypothetical protein
MRGLSKLETEIRILRRYFDDYEGVGKIADDMKVSRQYVFKVVANANVSNISLIAKAQISGIIRDSIAALSGLAEEVRTHAEAATPTTGKIDYEREEFLLRARRNTVDMYRQMYDCVAPLIQEFQRREQMLADQIPVYPSLPEPAIDFTDDFPDSPNIS